MDRRNRDRLVMTAFCRVAPAANRRRSTWKRIENISGAGMLVVWSQSDETETRAPRLGDRYSVELQLPPHPVFGQRALQFTTKVVRAFQQPNGRLMVGLQNMQSRFRSIAPGSWPKGSSAATVH
jgi:hypothetical protein